MSEGVHFSHTSVVSAYTAWARLSASKQKKLSLEIHAPSACFAPHLVPQESHHRGSTQALAPQRAHACRPDTVGLQLSTISQCP